jgi:hypothetical protein
VNLAGWALDPDTAASIDLHVYVDGTFKGVVPTSQNRPDIAAAFPGYGALHGFSTTMPLASGTHQLCAFGINSGPGSNTLFSCRNVTVSANPWGSLDVLARVPGGVRVSGWAIDPDTTTSISVTVRVNGQATTIATDVPRPDVAAVYPGYGEVHGFDRVVPAPVGTYSVCVTAENTGPGTSTPLGCRTVTVSNDPLGSLDVVQTTHNNINVAGWALDPDSTDSVDVHFYIDGAFNRAVTANLSRSDIAAAYPGYGAAHGFSTSLPTTTGTHQLCVFAINTGAGTNAQLGCLVISVP